MYFHLPMKFWGSVQGISILYASVNYKFVLNTYSCIVPFLILQCVKISKDSYANSIIVRCPYHESSCKRVVWHKLVYEQCIN